MSEKETFCVFSVSEELNFISRRGSVQTCSPDYLKNILDVSKNNFAKGISYEEMSFSKDDVSVDCDGFSIIIVVHDESSTEGCRESMLSGSREAIKSIMAVFGTDVTNVTLPKNANAVKLSGASHQANDYMFGGNDVELTDGPGKLCLLENEILVLDTPVKIAVHKDCAEKVCHRVNAKNYPCELSNKAGICLKPVGTMPCFGDMLDVILDSCYVPEANKWIIHFGGVGGRKPVEHDTFLQNLFEKISEVRGVHIELVENSEDGALALQDRITIEVAQLDLALNVKVPNGRLVRWAIDHRKSKAEKDPCFYEYSCFSGCRTDVWALHGLESEDGQICQDNQQMGTIRHKNKQQNNNNKKHNPIQDNHDPMIQDNDNTDRPNRPRPKKRRKTNSMMFDVLSTQEDSISDSDRILKEIYKNPNRVGACTSRLQECRSTVSNVKAYSTIAHNLLRDRFSFPLQQRHIDSTPRSSFIQLKRLLDKLEDTCTSNFILVDRYGVRARAEISIRPAADTSPNLRTQGHLVDLFTIFSRVVDERFVVKNSFCISTIPTDIVQVEVMKNLGNVQAMLKHRNSELFCNKYPSASCWLWLKASICHIMTLIGLTHHAKQQYAKKFVQDDKRFDPFELSNCMTNKEPEVVQTEDNDGIYDKLNEQLNRLLMRYGISEVALPALLNYFCKRKPCTRKEKRDCFATLSLADMVILAYHLPNTIIPEMLQNLIPHDSDPGVLDEKMEEEEEEFIFSSEFGDIDFTNQMQLLSLLDPTRHFTERMHDSYDLMHLGDPPPKIKYYLEKNCEVPDACHPVLVVLYNMNELHSMLSEDTPSFFDKLKKFVNSCHRLALRVPGSQASLSALELGFCQKSSGTPSIHTLLDEVRKLPVSSNATTKQQILHDIALYYGFPCRCDVPPEQSYINACSETRDLTDLIQAVQNMGSACKLPQWSRNSSKRKLYLEQHNSIVELPRKKSVMKSDSHVLVGIFKSRKYTKHNEMQEAILAKYTEFIQGSQMLYQFLEERLSNVDSLCDMMIDEKGNNLEEFLPFLDFDAILATRRDDPSFNDDFILPLLTLVLKRNILVADKQTNKFKLHVFHERPDLVVTYFQRTSSFIRPHLSRKFAKSSKCDVFLKTTSGQVIVFEFEGLEEDIATQQQKMIQMETGQPRSKSIKKKGSLALCLAAHLSSPQYQHPQMNHLMGRARLSTRMRDPLRIQDFLHELTRHQRPMQDWFDDTVMMCLHRLNIHSFCHIRNRLSPTDDDEDVDSLESDKEAFLSLIVSCLKYKLFIVLYSEGEGIFPFTDNCQMTQVFFFNHLTSKVMRLEHRGFHMVGNVDNFIYASIQQDRNKNLKFEYWTEVSPYLFPIKMEFYFNLLRSSCSYIDEFLFDIIIKQFKRKISMDYHVAKDIDGIPWVQVREKPIITIIGFAEDRTKLQYFPLIIYKSSDDSLSCIIIVQSHDCYNSESEENNELTIAAQNETNSFISTFSQKCVNTQQQIQREIYFIPELNPCSRSVSLLVAYIAHHANYDDFHDQLNRVLTGDVVLLWKKWLSEFLSAYGNVTRPFMTYQ